MGDRQDHKPIADLVRSLSKDKKARFMQANQLDQFGEQSVLYRPDPQFETIAYQRLHFGQTAFSICGVTHTTSGYLLPDPFVTLRHSPVEPWDGVICTAETVRTSLDYRLDAVDEYLASRFGGAPPPRPQMPVIPLGINTDEFQTTEADRAALRAEIGAELDDIVVSTLARLSPHFKFDPFPINLAMARAQKMTKRRLHLLFSGFFLGAYAKSVFQKGAATLAPDLKVSVRSADDADQRRQALTGSDIFIFPIDNIQETFGLAPI